MSKNTSVALHALVKRLSKSEKRYFKIYSSRHTIGEQNKYVQLFDYLDNEETYDEDKLFEYFKGEAFLNRFSITKNRLYESIMKSLHAFHSQSSISAQIYRMIHGADILISKSLYDQAWKQLVSAERLAKKHEKWSIFNEIAYTKKRIVEYGHLEINAQFDYALHYQKESDNHETILSFNRLWKLKQQLYAYYLVNGKARSEEISTTYTAFLLEAEKENTYANNAIENKMRQLQINSLVKYAQSNHSSAHSDSEQIIALIDQQGESCKEELTTKSVALYIQFKLFIEDKAFIEAQKIQQALMEIVEKHKSLWEDEVHTNCCFYPIAAKLQLFIAKGQYVSAKQFLDQNKETVQELVPHLNDYQKAVIHFYIARVYFGIESYSESLQWLQFIINETNLDQYKQFMATVQLFRLCLLFDMEREELLPYMLKSTQRYIRKNKRDFESEKLLLKYFHKLLAIDNQLDRIEQFEELNTKLKELLKHPFEQHLFQAFDFQAWVESKIKRKTFKSIRQVKVLNEKVA